MTPDTTSRTALLALQAEPEDPHSGRRMIAGASVLERQIDIALALGCSRIWLFAPLLDSLAIKAQKLAEQGGAQFRLVQRGRQLLGSLRQQDELLVLAEGLLPAEREGIDLLRDTAGILTIPAEEGVRAGFERLDREYCWAGGMILPGRVLERLEELGEDIDPVSALLRAGRVHRVEERTLPEGWLADGSWSLSPSRIPVAASGSGADEQVNPISAYIVDPVAGWLVTRPNLMNASGVLAAILAIAAILSIVFGLPALALLILSITGIFAKIWLGSRRHADARVFSAARRGGLVSSVALIIDAAAMAALALGLHYTFDWFSTIYMTILTAGIWLIAAYTRGSTSKYFRDRAPLWLGCAIAGFADQWFLGIAALTLMALLGIVLNLRNQPAITQA